ncbi:hypothetical protein PR048_023317 [Dryococelus australis]|uniref:Uncharacterized protein n=1 Tax=Dryococelus australis TaxID=614101 RepID=A0ABQ9GTS2_9NEOP|nr:hypothetical protein PR048_023317 [Dryococelus australis]
MPNNFSQLVTKPNSDMVTLDKSHYIDQVLEQFGMNNAGVSWCSKKQGVVAQSTVEEEFVSMGEVTKEITRMNGRLEQLGQAQFIDTSCTVRCYNQGAISQTINHVMSERVKHIEVKLHYVRECVLLNLIKFDYVLTLANSQRR